MAQRLATPVLVAGLGRFGTAVAETLVGLGHEVLAIDSSARIVQQHADVLTHVVEGDATNVDVLRQLGVGDLAYAVVGMGDNIESSILTVAALVDIGVPSIWAKAITSAHGRILERVGAHHVVFPEHDMGRRVARMVTGRMVDWVQLDEGFAFAETRPPRDVVGRTLAEAHVRARWGVTVVSFRPAGGSWTYATPETTVGPADMLVVAGETAAVQRFAETD